MKAPFYIAEWLVEPELNSLTANDRSHHIEPKVMKVLLFLAEHPQRVLSKEQIIDAVWPDTFVSDDVLTRCISVLRRVMDDDPHSPRFIQTVPKAGYRLLTEIHPLSDEIPPVASTGKLQAAEPQETHSAEGSVWGHGSTVSPFSLRNDPWLLWAVGIGIGLVTLAGFLFWKIHKVTPAPIQPAFRISAFASIAGEQDQAAISPDGNRVAFVATPEAHDEGRIYIKAIGSEAMTPLTLPGPKGIWEFSPVWSPDGEQIAYLADSPAGLGIYLASAAGLSSARKIFIPQDTVHWDQNALSWTPDGKRLLFPDHPSGHSYSAIYSLQLATLSASAVTSPPPGWEGDMNPAISPDGTQIAFIRASESAVRDIYVIPANGGTPRQLTHDRRNVNTLAWSHDGKYVLFSSDRGGKFALWKIALHGGDPVRLPVGVEDAYQPSVSQTGNRMAYTQSSALWSILGISLGSSKINAPASIISSTLHDSAPSFSPDGSQFAFQSWRSGNQEIWISSADGSRLRQLTRMAGSITGSPVWAAHSNRIAFDSRPDGHSHIFVVNGDGDQPQRITSGDFNDILPRWSADDATLYFSSNRGGRWQLWKVPSMGGRPRPVTSTEAIVASESPDGKWLYYTKAEEKGIWRMPVAGGDEEKKLDQPAVGFWGYWCVTKRGIYYLDASKKVATIELYQPSSSRNNIRVATLGHYPPPYSGITVTRDDRLLYLTDERNVGSHITLVEGLP